MEKINNPIITKNLFISDIGGNLLQIDIEDQKIIDNHGQIIDCGIRSMCMTPNNLTLFIGCSKGNLYEWSTTDKKIVKLYGKVHSNLITTMMVTADGRF